MEKSNAYVEVNKLFGYNGKRRVPETKTLSCLITSSYSLIKNMVSSNCHFHH